MSSVETIQKGNIIMIKPTSHEQWLDLNKESLGGSKIATILGLNKYETPYQLWARMKGHEPEVETTWAMIVGNFLEDAVAQMYAYESGARIIKASADPVMYVHPVYPFIKGTPDRRIVLEEKTKAVLEIKTTIANYDHDTIPASWFTQPMLYMGLTGLKKAVLCWFHLPTRELKWREIDFDQDMYDALVSEAVAFWNNYLLPDLPPPSLTSEDVVAKFPNHTPDTWVDALQCTDTDLLDIYAEIDRIDREIKPLEDLKNQLQEVVKLTIGHREGVSTSGTVLWTYRTNKPSEVIDTKALKKELPDVYQKYVMFKPGSRVLRRVKQ